MPAGGLSPKTVTRCCNVKRFLNDRTDPAQLRLARVVQTTGRLRDQSPGWLAFGTFRLPFQRKYGGWTGWHLWEDAGSVLGNLWVSEYETEAAVTKLL